MLRSGEHWLDTTMTPIQAHGGSILYDRGIYYWFGEDRWYGQQKSSSALVEARGIACYSSQDLLHWKNEGLALVVQRDRTQYDLCFSSVLERPRVIYNNKTSTYVMWMHIDTADYAYARTGVAISDTPTGPYYYLGSQRPFGKDSRDLTIFQDDDNRAYLAFSAEQNSAILITALTDDYLNTTTTYTRCCMHREAPVMFKCQGTYFIITSGCTGWDPGPAAYATSSSPLGPWRERGNPCIGSGQEKTFSAQGTFAFSVDEHSIFMADRWNRADLRSSGYIWLPMSVEKDSLTITWADYWEAPLPAKQGVEE